MNLKTTVARLTALFLVTLSSAVCHAAVISVQPTVGGFFTTAFDPIPPQPFYNFPVVVQIDVSMEVLSLAPAPHPNVDSNGPAPGGVVPLFPTNGDIGLDVQDYQGILVQMATGAFTNSLDPRRNVGEPGSPLGVPILLGSGYFEWNGQPFGSITLNPLEVAVKRNDGVFVAAVAAPVQPVQLGGLCPEPSSVVMLGGMLAGLGLRRQLG
jgi:hypothetical protein